ncbi:SagB family peptide dehydrogenase [Nocardia sp. NBC_00881]|uniref:SagB family peptide dehydrogenase n=1 Tax=Nocardia sp. NBC_00881 TaxID=2975995 RepID=UPI003865E61B|nr:SagB family peptide dehydrogenase [Nocardia sp. NBC_00881]
MTDRSDRYTLRPAGTCIVVPTGQAVLLAGPRREKLTGLSASQLHALRMLNSGTVTTADISTAGDSAVTALIDQLVIGGWLSVTVRWGSEDLYTIRPFATPRARPDAVSAASGELSKFTVLHREQGEMMLEHPQSWCDIVLHHPEALIVACGSRSGTKTDLPSELAARMITDLAWAGHTTADPTIEQREFGPRSWSAPDLWFHRRSTAGDRVLTGEHLGPTKWAKGQFPQPPARKAQCSADPIPLFAPDLEGLRATGPSVTTVIEDRYSCRDFDDARPMSRDELGELLYRSARTRSSRTGDGEELVSRPYPSGGSLYELELYPVVRQVDGLAAGMYHYDSFDHALRRVVDEDHPAVQQLLRMTSATLTNAQLPQLMLVIAARPGRIMWTYEHISYSVILKDVGVLTQTLYLVANAMGLGAVAHGFVDTAAFTEAVQVDELEECGVGCMIIGSPAKT